MRRFIQIMTATFIMLGMVSISQAKMAQSANKINSVNIKNYSKLLTVPNSYSKRPTTQAVQFNTIKLCYQYAYFSLYSRSQPMAYDPISDYVFISAIQPEWDGQGLSKIMGYALFAKAGTNNWDSIKVFNEDEMGISDPSISIHNTNGATNVQNVNLTLQGRFAPKYDEWRFSGLTYAFRNGGENVPDLNEYPLENNPGNEYKWSIMKSKSYPTSPYAYSAGILTVGMNPKVQYGAYGFLATDNENKNYIHSKIPSEWSLSIFRQAPQLSSSYNGPMEIAVDKDDNIYVAVNNIFAVDEDNRVVAVSKSTDGGASWSDFNRMPATLLQNYAATYQFETAIPYQVYNQMYGFVVYGNSYSYFYPLALVSQDTIREIHLVEAKFNGSVWSMNKVADINSFLPYAFYKSDKYPDAYDKFMIAEAPLGYEIQAAKTMEEDYLVVKWIDVGLNNDGTPKYFEYPTPIQITVMDANDVEQDATLPGMNIMDIYIARKKVNEGTWKVENITDDSTNYKATWIPDIVPAINKIPLTWASTLVYKDNTNPFNALPQSMRDRIVAFPFAYMGGTFTGPMSVTDELSNYHFNVLRVSPNPVINEAEFTFELEEPSNVSIAITNSLGQKVKEVLNGYAQAGVQGFVADLSDLPNGVYYFTLTANNRSETKVLNIVR